MKWFKDIDNLETLRKEYKRLVVLHHPDNGGSEDIIKEINGEYDQLFKTLKTSFERSKAYEQASEKQKQAYDWQKDEKIRETINQLSRFKGIEIEIIGVWIWVSKSFEYRKELKEMGFHFASQKKMWYKHFDDFHKWSSRPADMGYIRLKYGSTRIHIDREEKATNERRLKVNG